MARSYRAPGFVFSEHEFSVPLDHTRPDSGSITVFAREIAAPDGLDKPFLLFLQGGPGSEGPRPSGRPSGWVGRALQDYRVLMVDQRGTGRSTPVGSLPGMSPAEQADYLKLFRADSIVRDTELIRTQLGVERWSVLGQSFGGFCVMTYLSLFPDSLREAFLTGGLAPIGRRTDEVYVKTYERTLKRCRRFYERYPQDRERVLKTLTYLDSNEVQLPSGDTVTPRRFRQLGHMLGMSDGAERLHYLLELPLDSRAFLHDFERANPFSRNPLYAVIHEACYADGCATRWAAERVLPPEYQECPELLTGEHVFSWMFDDIRELRPLKEAARILAEYEWPPLYDRDILAGNSVPAAAAVYFEDMYVESEFSIETADQIRGLRPWITNEYEHDGLRADGERVLGRLIDLAQGLV